MDDGNLRMCTLNMKIDRGICIHIEIMTKVTNRNRKREGDRSKAVDEQIMRGLQEKDNNLSSQYSQFLLVNASTPIDMEDRLTAMDSQLMNVRSFAKKTLGSI